MATFFGEVVLDSSRAVDEDDDEDDNIEEIDSRVRWSPLVRSQLLKTADNKLPCQIMIVAVGAAAAGFAQAYILYEDFEIIGALFSGMKERDVNTLTQLSPTDKSCYVYRSRTNPQVLVCLCNTEVEPEQSYSWVTQLFSSINTTSDDFYLSILSTYSTSEYKSELPISDLETPFLRSLKTTRFPGTPLCPYLEQPNLTSGLPAQLLTYSQISNIKAVLYICYTDSIFLDSPTMKIFQPLLKSTPIRYIVQENPHSDEVINHIVQLHSTKHSLYI